MIKKIYIQKQSDHKKYKIYKAHFRKTDYYIEF